MKKFLSLVLSLVMVMSLVTISAGAKEFTDDDSITYQEAIDVISTIGVIDGYTDGSFKPTDNLTRGAAAKIICNLVLGPTTAGALSVGTAPFPDVPATSTFAGNIAYCANQGIISGYNDGTFKPGASLSGNAFMKMLLGALGYSAKQEGYTGANWSVNVAKDALGIGLADDLVEDFNGAKTVTREEACLYAFNTLSATMVEYSSNVTADLGTLGTISMNSPATNVRWSTVGITNDGNIRQDGFVQFAEKYFEKLVKRSDSDDFHRPAYTWTWDKNVEIGTYVDDSLLVTDAYTKEVKGGDIYNLLGSTTLNDYDLEVYVDGVLWKDYSGSDANRRAKMDDGDLNFKSAGEAMERTGNGVRTEIYMERPFLSVWDYSGQGTTNKQAGKITICIINTWLAQVTSNYSTSDKDAALKVYYNVNGGSTVTATKTVKLVDVPAIEGVEKDEFYLVNLSGKDRASKGIRMEDDSSKFDVIEIAEPEILEDSTVTKFSKDIKNNTNVYKKLTTGGTEYEKSYKAFYDTEVLDAYDDLLLTGTTYNIYMDAYGYFIGVDIYSGTRNYVFITGYDTNNSNLYNSNATAAAIFLDGTMETITVNRRDTNKNIQAAREKTNASADIATYYDEWDNTELGTDGERQLNRWYTYSRTSTGIYTLKPVMNNVTGEVRMMATLVDGVVNAEDTSDKEDTIKCNNVRLDGAAEIQNIHHSLVAANTGLRAYGEDDSIFIVAGVDRVDNGYGAITEVNGVYTGVQSVELVVRNSARWTDTENNPFLSAGTPVPESIYTVFDKDHYIIGSVIVGEAKGSTENYAYVFEAPISEEKIDDTYYWEIDVFHQGEKKTLQVRSKYTVIRDKLERASAAEKSSERVVELQFDGEYVTGVRELNYYTIKNVFDRNINKGNIVDNVYGVGVARHQTTKVDTVEAYDGTLYLQGRTLYISNGQRDYGLTFASGAHAYISQDDWNRPTGDSSYKEQKGTYDSVAEAFDRLNDLDANETGKQWTGWIFAALNSNGVAEWVVFDSYKEDIKPIGGSIDPGPGDDTYALTITNPDGGTVWAGDEEVTGGSYTAGTTLTVQVNPDYTVAITPAGCYEVNADGDYVITFPAGAVTVTFTKNGGGEETHVEFVLCDSVGTRLDAALLSAAETDDNTIGAITYDGAALGDMYRAVIRNADGDVVLAEGQPIPEGGLVYVQRMKMTFNGNSGTIAFDDAEVPGGPVEKTSASQVNHAVTRMALRAGEEAESYGTLTIGGVAFNVKFTPIENGIAFTVMGQDREAMIKAFDAMEDMRDFDTVLDNGLPFVNITDDYAVYVGENTAESDVPADVITTDADGKTFANPVEGCIVTVNGDPIEEATEIDPAVDSVKVTVDTTSLEEIEVPTVSVVAGKEFAIGDVVTAEDLTVTGDCTIESVSDTALVEGDNTVTVTVKAPAGKTFADGRTATVTLTINVPAAADPDVIDTLELVMTPAEPVAKLTESVAFSTDPEVAEISFDATKIDLTKAGTYRTELTFTAPEGKTFADSVVVTGDTKNMETTSEAATLQEDGTITIGVLVTVALKATEQGGNENEKMAVEVGEVTAGESAVQVYTRSGSAAKIDDIQKALSEKLGTPITLTVSGSGFTGEVTYSGGRTVTYRVTNASTAAHKLWKVMIGDEEFYLGNGMTVKGRGEKFLLAAGAPVGDSIPTTGGSGCTYNEGVFTAGGLKDDTSAFVSAVELNVATVTGVSYKYQQDNVWKAFPSAPVASNTTRVIVPGTKIQATFANTALTAKGAYGVVLMNNEEVAKVQRMTSGSTTTTDEQAFEAEAAAQDVAASGFDVAVGKDKCNLNAKADLFYVTILGQEVKAASTVTGAAEGGLLIPDGTSSVTFEAVDGVTKVVNEDGDEPATIDTSAGTYTVANGEDGEDETTLGHIIINAAVSVKGTSTVWSAYTAVDANNDVVASKKLSAAAETVLVGKPVYLKVLTKNTTLKVADDFVNQITLKLVDDNHSAAQYREAIYEVTSTGAAIDDTSIVIDEQLLIAYTGNESTFKTNDNTDGTEGVKVKGTDGSTIEDLLLTFKGKGEITAEWIVSGDLAPKATVTVDDTAGAEKISFTTTESTVAAITTADTVKDLIITAGNLELVVTVTFATTLS